MSQPNVILLTCHDLGDYLPMYGTPVPTPNLQRMADRGVVFHRHFSTATVCSPARASIMTGCYPHTHRCLSVVHRGWALDTDRCPTLPAILGRAGYESHLFGTQHEHYDWRRLGYDENHQAPTQYVDDVVPMLCDWLRARPEGAGPFFASVGYGETHRWGLKPSHFKRDVYDPADPADVHVRPYLPDIPEVREDLADFYGAVKLVDAMVGRLLETLDETGLAERTLLIFTSDHGASFTHSKATLYDGGTKVALLMHWPGRLPESRTVEALTSHADLVPTLAGWLDLDAPTGVEGRSFAALAEGTGGSPRDFVVAERDYTNYYCPARMIRSAHVKYIRNGLRTCAFDFQIPEIELSGWGWRENEHTRRFYSARRCLEELYDLRADPAEMNNLADDNAYAGTLETMRAALDRHLEATDDPFRHLKHTILMDEHVFEEVIRGRP